MAGSVPWSVNAVDPEAWADARDAARRSGQSVGEWLEAAIRNAANDRHPPRALGSQNFDPIEQRLDDIAERIEHFSRQSREPSASRFTRGDAAFRASLDTLNERIDSLGREMRSERNGPAEVRAAIQKLEDRIEHLLSRGRIADAGVPPDLERKLDGISRAIETMSRRLAQENSGYDAAPVPSTVEELDAAVAEIMMRQSLLDGTPPPSGLPRSAPRASAAAPSAAPDFSGLERQLKQMADDMQALRQSGLQTETVRALRTEIADLAAKLGDLAPRRSLESIERAIDTIALRIDRAGGSRADDTLTEVVEALHDIRSALADVRPAESFVSVEKDLQALSTKLDSLGSRGIDSGAVARLQQQTLEIRDLLAGALPSDVLKALVEQIEMLVGKFEERRREPDTAILDVMSAFDRRIDTLSERIDAANRQAPTVPALDEIRRRLDDLKDVVSRTSEGSGDRVEATLRSLAQKMDATEARLSNLGSIERGLSDLSSQLEEVRTSTREVNARTVQAPARDADLQRRAPGELETKYTTAERRSEAPAEQRPSVSLRETARPELRQVSPLRPMPTSELEEGIEPDQPLEPGSGMPRLRLQSAALRVAQSEAALADIGTPSIEAPARASDFIAAARRAAQAANAEPAAEPAKSSGAGIGARIISLFGSARRALLIGVTAILLIVAAFRFLDGNLPIPFRSSAPAPAPIIIAPKATAPSAPAPAKDAPPVQEKQSRIESRSPITSMTAAPPAGVLGNNRDVHFSGDGVAAPETTGSTASRNTTTGSIQTAAAPAGKPASEAADPADAIPAALGSSALRSAAIAGDPVAAYEIGSRYLDGRGVRADAAEAAVWLERAAAKGSIPAIYRLGSIHEKGLNGKKNTAEALRHYQRAAEGGNIRAMHNLAVIFAEGGEGQTDMRAAVRWFRMAADRGVRDSQYNLGVLYARGLGVEQNFAESYRWFAIAANQGDADGGKKRDDVAKRLDVQTLVATKLAVQTWVPAKIDQAANDVRLKPEWESAEAPQRKRSVKK